MTDRNNRVYDEFARLITDAASVAQGVKREAETLMRSQAERFLADMDLVRREEFDAIKEMAANARLENEKLAARIAVLEAKLMESPAVAPGEADADQPASAAKRGPRRKASPDDAGGE